MVNYVDKEEEDPEELSQSPQPSSLSPNMKKRKLSVKKDDLILCLDNMEESVENLDRMVRITEMVDDDEKERLGNIVKKLQNILQSL